MLQFIHIVSCTVYMYMSLFLCLVHVHVAMTTHISCRFVEEGEFWTHSPLPQIKFTLMAVSKGLISDNKTIAKVRWK